MDMREQNMSKHVRAAWSENKYVNASEYLKNENIKKFKTFQLNRLSLNVKNFKMKKKLTHTQIKPIYYLTKSLYKNSERTLQVVKEISVQRKTHFYFYLVHFYILD